MQNGEKYVDGDEESPIYEFTDRRRCCRKKEIRKNTLG